MSDKEDDGPEIYEVERIVKKKIEPSGEVLYFIKWEGYPGECLCLRLLSWTTKTVSQSELTVLLPFSILASGRTDTDNTWVGSGGSAVRSAPKTALVGSSE